MPQIAPLATTLPAFIDAQAPSALAVLVDNHTARHCYPLVKSLLPKHTLIKIPAGETNKNLGTCETIWGALTNANFDRHALVLNLGGGVIGDMGGFCAATYKRGIAFAQLPTTLLSQVDASVGGKLGIDFQGFKNHIGVFTQPNDVLIDTAFLGTLPPRELRSGFAEVIKHCLIADAAEWERLRRYDLEDLDWNTAVAHSVAIKQRVVEQDPTEKGLRKILNFGHTLGHAVETHFLERPKGRLLHGEAIAAGMIMEAFIAHQKGMIDAALLAEIEEYLFAVYGNVPLTEADLEPVLAHTLQDKKNRAGQVRMALIDGPGQCAYDVPVTKSEMRQALDYYRG
ncbi:3-dehydroquinate synthase [Fibrella aestuarina BUZ 2]|uniref:3-dehydroquinate synthase n=1 Tax=Fibrella aestuarina BUZ 2 TaxID=1166018 RepID=I0K6F3_9BACT|nr:3-dehydroquinate synthase [Fibrella aestuarina]CCG99706.1 3-dehydroquinate synthase [Fibrella aestuarina BUZ 2]